MNKPQIEMSRAAMDHAVKFDEDLQNLIARTADLMRMSGISVAEGVSGLSGVLIRQYLLVLSGLGMSTKDISSLFNDFMNTLEQGKIK